MRDGITRRDFLNGVAIAIAGGVAGIELAAAGTPAAAGTSAAAGAAASGAAADPNYPPNRSGLRGSHAGSFEAAHRLRDGGHFDLAGVAVSEHYDLIVVGAGISGLAAAHFYAQRRPGARILLLDTNDDFGGHAKRNEFDVDGRTLIGYGGTQSIDGPKHKWSAVASALLRDLGIDVQRLGRDFDQIFYERWNLRRATFFKQETFGTDRIVRQDFSRWGVNSWSDWTEQPDDPAAYRAYLERSPLNARARAQLHEMCFSDRDVLAGKSIAERTALLDRISGREFLRTYWDADDDVLKYLQTRTRSLWVVGIDALSASDTLHLPGFKAQRAALRAEADEPYVYHFPDGNASITRLLVRRLVPDAARGSTMDDVVRARFDYGQLDRPEHAVRVRLLSTAVEVRNAGGGVEVGYVTGGRTYRVAARDCVLACYHAMMPYLAPEIPPPQRAAMHANVRAPLVYATLAVRNWHPWKKLGAAFIDNPGGTFDASLDFPVSVAGYGFSADPSQPICVHLEHMPVAPNQGLDMRAQFRVGRTRLYTATFADFEREIRDELGRMLGAYGFDFDRDVAAITVNRWPHGYAYTPTPLYDDPEEQKRRVDLARQRVGRIAIANSDSGWDAYTHVAIDEAHRAVMELLAAQ
jgi:spermidine dehydrogenase